MTDKKPKLTEADLAQFTGTEQWYRHPLFRKYLYTDGVQYVAEKGEAYWLIGDIFMYQSTQKELQGEGFLVWKLTLNDEGHGAVLSCEDGNHNKLWSTKIDFTDFPLKSITFWCVDNVLILPSEY